MPASPRPGNKDVIRPDLPADHDAFMNSSDQSPKLPAWIFIVTDLALIGAAVIIAASAGGRPSTGQTIAIVLCVAVGAIVGLVPLVARYERQKNEALDERQRALEALAPVVSSTAEQIGIATSGLHAITENAHKTIRAAEQLPHKLHEKIAEFQALVAQGVDAEKEELERELLALRTSESERLDSVSQRIAKSSAEWAKLEAATLQHLTAANEAVAKLQLGTANAIGKAQAAAEQALAHARTEAARSLGETSGAATKSIEAAKAAALADLETAIAAALHAAAAKATADFEARLAAATRSLDERLSQLAAAATTASQAPSLTPAEPAVSSSHDAPVAASTEPSPSEPAAPATRRARKPRREEPAADSGATPTITAEAESHTAATAASVTPPATEAAESTASTPAPAENDEPSPVPADKFREITPVAPVTAEPFPGALETTANGTHVPTSPPATEPEPPKASRRRTAPRAEDTAEAEPNLGLEFDEASGHSAASVAERTLSSDGATRLLVTAYIGIGNRLFIRGEGPGLSWEKGVPLQFLSIGKWRWETSDASGPVQFKLYKNDDTECTALGAQSLDPGHQQEVTASF